MKVTGTVKDAKKKIPLEGAKVCLYIGERELAALYTDSKGEFEHQEAASYVGETLIFQVEKEGFDSQEMSRKIKGEEVSFEKTLVPKKGGKIMKEPTKKWPKIVAGAAAVFVMAMLIYLLVAMLQLKAATSQLKKSAWDASNDNIHRTIGNIGIGTVDPLAELTVNGSMIRRVAIATGLGPIDENNEGQIKSRLLVFTKLYDDTAIRIVYCDNLGIHGNQAGSRWYIRIDGLNPPDGPIYQDKFVHNYSGHRLNINEPTMITGYAKGVPAGIHRIQVWVGPTPGYSVNDACTGWNNSRWTLEAQEVWLK